MKKKNIEKIFQEKLLNYSQLPEEHVWNNIASSLDRKHKKRRLLPIWWQLGGVAAILIIGLFLFLPKEELPKTNEIITKTQAPSGTDDPSDLNNGTEKQGEIRTLESTDAENVLSDVSENDADESLTEKGVSAEKINLVPGNEKEGGKENGSILVNVTPGNNKEVNVSIINENDSGSQAVSEIAQTEPSSGTNDAENNKVTAEEKRLGLSKEALANNSNSEQQKKAPDSQNELKKDDKISIYDAVAAQDEETEKDNASGKWAVGPRIAPVFFSSLSQGSPIHSSFQNNAKSGNVNVSYGLAVTYNISNKIRLRSGVHKVDFGYDTRDVSFSSSINGTTNEIIDNIDYSLSSSNLVVRSNTNSGKIPSGNALDVSGPDPSLNGKMIQEFGYLEVPLELTYQLFNKKFGVNIIGGVSSLFLVNNSVTLESNGDATEMGEANNLNDLNVSTNFGIGVSYQLNTSLQLSLEPMFKYQLNTFSEAAGNFQPFSMGVYSGLNFKF